MANEKGLSQGPFFIPAAVTPDARSLDQTWINSEAHPVLLLEKWLRIA
ncbi:MAG TPA: hypothetical protein VNO35_12815 [Steroidobacteraceae bacterium]|nr:hypothetical protein [Steroidobacteraceae bacterium]